MSSAFTPLRMDSFAEDRIRTSDTATPVPTEHWNFFRRMFNIKPESKCVVLCLGRNKAREIVCRLLRDANRHGITDVARDPENRNCLTARLDKPNCKCNPSFI